MRSTLQVGHLHYSPDTWMSSQHRQTEAAAKTLLCLRSQLSIFCPCLHSLSHLFHTRAPNCSLLPLIHSGLCQSPSSSSSSKQPEWPFANINQAMSLPCLKVFSEFSYHWGWILNLTHSTCSPVGSGLQYLYPRLWPHPSPTQLQPHGKHFPLPSSHRVPRGLHGGLPLTTPRLNTAPSFTHPTLPLSIPSHCPFHHLHNPYRFQKLSCACSWFHCFYSVSTCKMTNATKGPGPFFLAHSYLFRL